MTITAENTSKTTPYYFATMVLESGCLWRNPEEIGISIIFARPFSVSAGVSFCFSLLLNLRKVLINQPSQKR